MANDKIFNPCTRQCVTVIEPNNNSAAILDDRVFDIESGRSIVLSAIESIDTGIITGTVNIDLVLSALEAVDSTNITADNLITAYLEESENLDTVLLEAKAILAVSLSEIEDTDVVNITAFSDVDRNAEILSTERKDSVRVVIHNKVIGKTRTYIPCSRIGRVYLPTLNAKIFTKEKSDEIKTIATTDRIFFASTKERRDGMLFFSSIKLCASIQARDERDSIENDASGFIASVKLKNEQYQNHEIELFSMVA